MGFSVTIPHKQAALEGAQEVDPVAAQARAAHGTDGVGCGWGWGGLGFSCKGVRCLGVALP